MPDGGYYAIKGFEFQIDKTIIEIFNADSDIQISIESIQDLNSNSFVTQVKYKETQDYTNAKIKAPVIQLIEEYQKDSGKTYYLYCYFKDKSEGEELLDVKGLNQILGNKSSDFTDSLKSDFCQSFKLCFSSNFQTQFSTAIDKIKTQLSLTDYDEVLLYYSSVANHLRKIVVNHSAITERTCTKREILNLIDTNRKKVFNSAFREYKGEQRYYSYIKRKLFTNRNIDNWERFFTIQCCPTDNVDSLKSICYILRNKFYKNQNGRIKSGAPYILFHAISQDTIKKMKSSLQREGVIFRDGYSFNGAEFYLNDICKECTDSNEISLKLICEVEELNKLLQKDFKRRKLVYQFFLDKTVDISCDVEQCEIEIKSISDIENILR